MRSQRRGTHTLHRRAARWLTLDREIIGSLLPLHHTSGFRSLTLPFTVGQAFRPDASIPTKNSSSDFRRRSRLSIVTIATTSPATVARPAARIDVIIARPYLPVIGSYI